MERRAHGETAGDAAPLIAARDLRRRYGRGAGLRAALDGVSLELARGEFLAVVGPSGCGKSTLLGVLGCLDRSFEGQLALFGKDTRPLGDRQLARLRGARIGFVFQAFHLLGHLSALDNVLAPALFAGGAGGEAPPANAERAEQLLAELGLEGRGADRPEQLSGGERQRVAIARALLMGPELLLCDEPTGNLDAQTGRQIVDIFRRLHQDQGLSIVAVTHEPLLSGAADRTLQLRAGKIIDGDAQPAEAAP